jgi:hypothetical protein
VWENKNSASANSKKSPREECSPNKEKPKKWLFCGIA